MQYLLSLAIILIGISCSISEKVKNNQPLPVDKATWSMEYNQFCFSSGFCTDSFLIRFIHSTEYNSKIETKPDSLFLRVNILPKEVKNSSDSLIINQFLLSLKAYNFYGKVRKPSVIWTQFTFFQDPENMKQVYTTHLFGSPFTIYNLSDLKRYDFKYKITETKNPSSGQVTISFDDYETYIICPIELYKKIILQRHLNFISKNHHISPYNLGITPIGF